MNIEKINEQVWEKVEKWKGCGDCPLKHKNKKPLLFKPGRPVKVMVITEGPNRIAEEKVIASLANHPTYTFLSALFDSKFEPIGENATAYWTHVRKCFISDKDGIPLCKDDKKRKESFGKMQEQLSNERNQELSNERNRERTKIYCSGGLAGSNLSRQRDSKGIEERG